MCKLFYCFNEKADECNMEAVSWLYARRILFNAWADMIKVMRSPEKSMETSD